MTQYRDESPRSLSGLRNGTVSSGNFRGRAGDGAET